MWSLRKRCSPDWKKYNPILVCCSPNIKPYGQSEDYYGFRLRLGIWKLVEVHWATFDIMQGNERKQFPQRRDYRIFIGQYVVRLAICSKLYMGGGGIATYKVLIK